MNSPSTPSIPRTPSTPSTRSAPSTPRGGRMVLLMYLFLLLGGGRPVLVTGLDLFVVLAWVWDLCT